MDAYFLNGCSLSLDTYWGYFGIITEGNVTNYMYLIYKINRYMAFILSLGLFTSNIFITKLYEPVVPASSALFEPIGCGLINHMIGV